MHRDVRIFNGFVLDFVDTEIERRYFRRPSDKFSSLPTLIRSVFCVKSELLCLDFLFSRSFPVFPHGRALVAVKTEAMQRKIFKLDIFQAG